MGKDILYLIKYTTVGGVAFVADFSVFCAILTFKEVDYLVAGMYGFLVGVFVNYFLARRYVFNSRVKVGRVVEVLGVYVISGIGLIIHQISIFILAGYFNNNIYFSKVMATFVVLLWNYNVRRMYIYGE